MQLHLSTTALFYIATMFAIIIITTGGQSTAFIDLFLCEEHGIMC